MSKTIIHLTLEAPHTSFARIGDFMDDLRKLLPQHKVAALAANFTQEANDATHSGNARADGGGGTGGSGGNGGGRVDGRSDAARRAAEDFAEGSGADGAGPEGEPAAEPAAPRRRGRPPGSGNRAAGGAEASGTPARGRKRAEGSGGAAEGTARTEPVGTRQGADKGAGEGQGRRGGAGGGGDDQRGNREAPRISSGGDRGEAPAAGGWDEEDATPAVGAENSEEGAEWWCKTPDFDDGSTQWPDHLMPEGDIDLGVLGTLSAGHFTAAGGKDREPTYALTEKVTGQRALKNVDPQDYPELAAALLKDTARYEHGVKKPT